MNRLTITLLCAALMSCGCHPYSSPTPYVPTPPTNAAKLTGEQITNYTPQPGLPSDPSDHAFLQAIRLLHLSGHTARSATFLVTFHDRGGKITRTGVAALVVGKQILVAPVDFARAIYISESPSIRGDSFRLGGKEFATTRDGTDVLDQDSPGNIRLVPGSQVAEVGGHPIMWEATRLC